MDNSANSITSADKQYKKGLEELKTGIFKWSKDYNSAVSYFEEAFKQYKQCKAWDQAIQALYKCIECNEKLNEMWGTARNYQEIATIMMDNQKKIDFEQIKKICDSAEEYFRASDSFTEAVKLYMKLAKYLVQNQQVDQALATIEKALQVAEESGKAYERGQVFEYYVEVLVEYDNYDKSITVLKQEIQSSKTNEKQKYQSEQWGLCIISLCLLQKEIIRAEQELDSLPEMIPGYFATNQYQLGCQLVKAYQEGDQEEFNKLVVKATMTSLYPPNIPKKIRKLKVPQLVAHKNNKQNENQQKDNDNQQEEEEQKEENIGDLIF